MGVKNFIEAPNAKTFKYGGAHIVLKNTLEELFSAGVTILLSPIPWCLSEANIDIELCPMRNVYIPNEDRIILLPRIHTEKADYVLGIVVESIGIKQIHKMLHRACELIAHAINDDFHTRFMSGHALYNQNLSQAIAVKEISVGGYNQYKVNALVDMMNAIRTTTFEGKYFSTGLIVTKSIHKYKNERKQVGEVKGLFTESPVFDKINTRFWYLVDGEKSFYLTDLKSSIHYLYQYKKSDEVYVNKLVLHDALHGHDFLIRTTNGRELSIITAKGKEFIYQENAWRYRDYDLLHQRILKVFPSLSDEVYESILYYVLYCSKNDTSSIIWIVDSKEQIHSSKILKTYNRFTRSNLSIIDIGHGSIIKRLLSSDGAVAISQTGEILYYGCIVDLSKTNVRGVKGTGETAASALARNGVAIKISQDGCIKVHLNVRTKVIF